MKMQSTSMETAAAAAALPNDLLAGIFGRLPVRSLAASRGTCKPWRDLIDERQLLLRFRRLLPHTVRGLFINYEDYRRPHFLSRPTPTPSTEAAADGSPRRIDGKFDFIEREPYGWYEVVDHCNGLVLFLDSDANVLHVCNPTTRWSAALPPCPARAACYYDAAFAWGNRRAFLVFDPFVSPAEYKVLLSPADPDGEQMEKDDACCPVEWPPSLWTAWYEFSSRTARWEEKVFVREGKAAGTARGLLDKWGFHHVELQCRYAAYWQGALYIHCRGEYVSRFSLLDDNYRVIESPIELAECKIDDVRTFLGRSENGVYFAAIAEKGLASLRVWTLNESSGPIEWVPKDQSNLKINVDFCWVVAKNEFDKAKYWVLDFEPEYCMFSRHGNGRKNQGVLLEQNVCWNSDDDNIVDISDGIDEGLPYVTFLGFHPYREVIFLCCDGNAVAFHLDSPKMQYLGRVDLAGTYNRGIRESFVYTPCLIRD